MNNQPLHLSNASLSKDRLIVYLQQQIITRKSRKVGSYSLHFADEEELLRQLTSLARQEDTS